MLVIRPEDWFGLSFRHDIKDHKTLACVGFQRIYLYSEIVEIHPENLFSTKKEAALLRQPHDVFLVDVGSLYS